MYVCVFVINPARSEDEINSSPTGEREAAGKLLQCLSEKAGVKPSLYETFITFTALHSGAFPLLILQRSSGIEGQTTAAQPPSGVRGDDSSSTRMRVKSQHALRD